MDQKSRPTAYEFGDFRIDLLRRVLVLRVDGRPLPLTSRAFDTLLFLVEHPGELLDKSAIMAAVWPKIVVEENNLNQHISTLRRVLGDRTDEHRFIITVSGRGYRFVAPVTPLMPTAASGTTLAAAPKSATDAVSPLAEMPAVADTPPARAVPSPSRAVRLSWMLGAAALVAAGTVWYLTHRLRTVEHAATRTSIEVAAVRTPRLAILPFENLSPDPNNAFFTDGLHEEIISTLAERVPGIEVISRTTMMSYRANPPKPLTVVAHELNASHLLEGSVRRVGNRIRLTLQLIDARTDGHIWSASYDRTLADALSLESQIAEEIAGHHGRARGR